MGRARRQRAGSCRQPRAADLKLPSANCELAAQTESSIGRTHPIQWDQERHLVAAGRLLPPPSDGAPLARLFPFPFLFLLLCLARSLANGAPPASISRAEPAGRLLGALIKFAKECRRMGELGAS